MLALIAKNIGNGNGASLSALDVLIALGQIDSDIKLIYTYKNNLPYKLDGKKVHTNPVPLRSGSKIQCGATKLIFSNSI